MGNKKVRMIQEKERRDLPSSKMFTY